MAQQTNFLSDINLNVKAQGQPGKDGKTPIMGIDYWTKGDQDAIKQWIEDTIWKGKWG